MAEFDNRLWTDLRKDIGSKSQILAFLNRISILPNGCWEWTGRAVKRGNGSPILRVYWRGVETTAQRISWRLWRGEILPGHFVNRKCVNHLCVCPRHLYSSSRPDSDSYVARRIFAEREVASEG
jgi:hypothetical protein